MARARALSNGADDGEARGATTEVAPRLTPMLLAETAVAAIAELLRENVGTDFSHGAVAVGAILPAGHDFNLAHFSAGGLLAEGDEQRLIYLVPLGTDADATLADDLLARLTGAGMEAIASAPRRNADDINGALHETGVLLELLAEPYACLRAHEPTYRLLLGVLLHDPDEVTQLRESTIAPLESYDSSHDTELVTTLETFLTNHGSTTDTAEIMGLHRHTVGYRLARVQEVSGLSPYESEGRERLSLGLKAYRILLADSRRAGRS
jgi:PucR C-terminal helix-turn-helix domain